MQNNQKIFVKNKILAGFKNAVGSVVENFTEISKSLAGSIFGLNEEENSELNRTDSLNFNESLLCNSPIMHSLTLIMDSINDHLLKSELK